MDNFIVLYNPLAGNGTAQDKMRELESLMQGDSLYFSNMLDIRDYIMVKPLMILPKEKD